MEEALVLKSNSVEENKSNNVLLFSILYKILLDVVFVVFVAKKYGYMGFPYSFSPICLAFSCLVTLAAGYYVQNVSNRDSSPDLIIVFLIYMYLFPQGTLCAFSLNDLNFYLYVILYFGLLIFLNQAINFTYVKLIGGSEKYCFEWVVIAFGLLMIVISGYYTGFRVSFNIDDFYEYRMEAREYDMPSVLAYLFQWAKTLLPIGTLYALIRKKKVFVLFTTICQILCFSFNGKKSVLFTTVLVFLLYFFYSSKLLDNIPKIFTGLAFVTVIEIIIRGGESFLGNKFVRRMMIVPSYLGWAYYDFFSKNEPDYLRTSVLRRFGFESPYEEAIPRLIGRVYFDSDGTMNANTGLCGDAFSNFGWYSLIFYPLLLVLLFKFLSNCMEGLDKRISFLVSFLVAYMLLSGTFFKCLLTGGLLLIGLLMTFINREDQRSET